MSGIFDDDTEYGKIKTKVLGVSSRYESSETKY